MRQRGWLATCALVMAAVVGGGPALGQEGTAPPGVPEPAGYVFNTPTDPEATGVTLLQAENALLTRLSDRIVIHVRLRTPKPGSYRYALSVPEAQWAAPEVFTGWLFVFNRPERCISETTAPRCGPEDFGKAARGGVYNVGAHVSSINHHGTLTPFTLDEGTDGYVVIAGEILVGSDPLPRLPPDAGLRVGLEDPLHAEVHLAIVSHGQLDPATLPGELYEPEGVPDCGCWWLAIWPGSDAG